MDLNNQLRIEHLERGINGSISGMRKNEELIINFICAFLLSILSP
jgi:hypothetical protein